MCPLVARTRRRNSNHHRPLTHPHNLRHHNRTDVRKVVPSDHAAWHTFPPSGSSPCQPQPDQTSTSSPDFQQPGNQQPGNHLYSAARAQATRTYEPPPCHQLHMTFLTSIATAGLRACAATAVAWQSPLTSGSTGPLNSSATTSGPTSGPSRPTSCVESPITGASQSVPATARGRPSSRPPPSLRGG